MGELDKLSLGIGGVLSVLIIIIIVFSFMAGSSEEIKTAADSVTDANNCSTDEIFYYNTTDTYCYQVGLGRLYKAKNYALPLNSLFGRNSVIVMLSMLAVLFTLIVVAIKVSEKRK